MEITNVNTENGKMSFDIKMSETELLKIFLKCDCDFEKIAKSISLQLEYLIRPYQKSPE